jgi:xanthine dehydrogenase accessory factor
MEEKQGQSPSQQISKAISEFLDAGKRAVVVTVIAGATNIGAKLLIEENGSTLGSLGSEQLDSLTVQRSALFLQARDETRMVAVGEFAPDYASSEILLLFEKIEPLLRLVVCGAGHVGAALARLGDFVGYHTTLIDDRAEFVTPDRYPDGHIELVVANGWTQTVREAIGKGNGVAVAVVTRGHSQDEECLEAIMATTPFYVGLIGSKRRTNIVIENLRRSGVSEAQLKQIRAPIGLDIGAVTPEEVALAIIAEIVAERRGGKGGSLSAWRREVGR